MYDKVVKALQQLRDATKAKHQADMAYMQAEQDLISALKDIGIKHLEVK